MIRDPTMVDSGLLQNGDVPLVVHEVVPFGHEPAALEAREQAVALLPEVALGARRRRVGRVVQQEASGVHRGHAEAYRGHAETSTVLSAARGRDRRERVAR